MCNCREYLLPSAVLQSELLSIFLSRTALIFFCFTSDHLLGDFSSVCLRVSGKAAETVLPSRKPVGSDGTGKVSLSLCVATGLRDRNYGPEGY